MQERIQDWIELAPLYEIFTQPASAYILIAILLLFAARLIKKRCSSYDLDHELTEKDNKAIAIENGGYFLAVLLLVANTYNSSTTGEDAPLIPDMIAAIGWCLFSFLLLGISHLLNDKLLLSTFCNRKELVEDQNPGTAAVIAGTYIGSAMIISASLQGEAGGPLWLEIIDTVVYFIIAQIAFLALGAAYQKFSKFDLHGEIERDNAAVGIAFGANLLALGIMLSGQISRSDSLLALGAWALVAIFTLLATRFLVDRFLLPNSPLDKEIEIDKNWGAAIIEGSTVIGIAFVVNASYIY